MYYLITKMAQSETVDRILDAAEQLFAERGFSETSLRQITSKAKVNLAAVNYHFGSKNALIQAVFARFINPFTRILRERLKNADEGQQAVSLEELLQIITLSIVSVPSRNEKSLSIFMRLLGLAYTQSQGHLRKYLEEQYRTEFKLFMRLLREATPHLSPIERFWRMQFMLGAVAFTMSSSDALGSILENEKGVRAPVEQIVAQLVPFLAAGINAPSHAGKSEPESSGTATAGG